MPTDAWERLASEPVTHALTLRQPWPFCIVERDKRVENRSRPIPRGWVGRVIALHAGAGPHDDSEPARDVERYWRGREGGGGDAGALWPKPRLRDVEADPHYPRRCVIATARLWGTVFVHRTLTRAEVEAGERQSAHVALMPASVTSGGPDGRPWRDAVDAHGGLYTIGPFGWILDRVRVPTEPIRCEVGALGLWELPAATREAMEAAQWR